MQTRSPVGLVVLSGQDQLKPWIDAETVTWLGVTDSPNATGDVLTLSVRMRDVATGTEARAGRMIVSMGAVRPVHLDGARGLVRVFGGTTAEAFAGVPVAPRFDYRTFDFAAGGRLGQALGDRAAVGASYLQRRSDGRVADEEVGADLAVTPVPWLSAAGRTAFDLVTRGPTDALASIGAHNKDARIEVFTTHRSPGRMLPSTSLFSVLGDFAATSVGSTVRWRAFPRLELVATGRGQTQGGELGGQGLGRVTLALDDEFAGTLGLEVRRVDFNGARWVGARGIVAVPLSVAWRVATEVEVVRPDDPRDRGSLWPWALVALGYRTPSGWDFGAGLEGSSGPENRSALYALARASYAFGTLGGGR